MASSTPARNAPGSPQTQIDDFPRGYPRYSALLSSHSSFDVYRRFSNLRSRLLLKKQDALSQLEEELEELDRQDNSSRSLGASRKDPRRTDVLKRIDAAFSDYDSFLERRQRICQYASANPRAVMNLQAWVDSTKSLSRAETAYLKHDEDLFSLNAPQDNISVWIEAMIVDLCTGILVKYLPLRTRSRDCEVFILPPIVTARVIRVFTTLLISTILLTPVLLCHVLSNPSARLFMVMMTAIVFVAAVCHTTNARTIELIVSGTTYIAVLVVFISDKPVSS